jgi:hypothetical protein
MRDDDFSSEGFEEMLRSLARELTRSADRLSQFDVESMARMFGFDPDSARNLFDSAGSWLRSQSEGLGDDAMFPWGSREPWVPDEPVAPQPPPSDTKPAGEDGAAEVFGGAVPHPLDMPSDEQGLALAALESGRWTIEPGSEMLTAPAGGPGPNDALGLVRELRNRDWITAEGKVTLAGRGALKRWLEAAGERRTTTDE